MGTIHGAAGQTNPENNKNAQNSIWTLLCHQVDHKVVRLEVPSIVYPAYHQHWLADPIHEMVLLWWQHV